MTYPLVFSSAVHGLPPLAWVFVVVPQLTHIRWPNVTFKRWPDVEMVRWQTVGQPLDIGYFQRIPNTFPTLSQRSIYIQT